MKHSVNNMAMPYKHNTVHTIVHLYYLILV